MSIAAWSLRTARRSARCAGRGCSTPIFQDRRRTAPYPPDHHVKAGGCQPLGDFVRDDDAGAFAGGHLPAVRLAHQRRDCLVRLCGGRNWAFVCADRAADVVQVGPIRSIFVPVDFAAIGLYLLYIDLAVKGGWFLSFAFPVTAAIGLLSDGGRGAGALCPCGGYLYIFGGALILCGRPCGAY